MAVKEEMGGGRECQPPPCSHWAVEGFSICGVWQTEISNGFQNALESMFVRLQVSSVVLNVHAAFLCAEQIVVICLVAPELFRGPGIFFHVCESIS